MNTAFETKKRNDGYSVKRLREILGVKQEDLRVEKGSFLFTALADYYKKSDIEGEYKMIFYTNKYQMSEVSKAVDGGVTAAVCKKLDDMLLYRVKVA